MKNRVTKEQIEALLNEGFNRTQVANKLQIATCTLRAKLEQVLYKKVKK
jgi:DNA-binding NtrC family response regulator